MNEVNVSSVYAPRMRKHTNKCDVYGIEKHCPTKININQDYKSGLSNLYEGRGL
jgi:hypothetical protein